MAHLTGIPKIRILFFAVTFVPDIILQIGKEIFFSELEFVCTKCRSNLASSTPKPNASSEFEFVLYPVVPSYSHLSS